MLAIASAAGFGAVAIRSRSARNEAISRLISPMLSVA
jgi:hypothetical protein